MAANVLAESERELAGLVSEDEAVAKVIEWRIRNGNGDEYR